MASHPPNFSLLFAGPALQKDETFAKFTSDLRPTFIVTPQLLVKKEISLNLIYRNVAFNYRAKRPLRGYEWQRKGKVK